MTTPWLRYALAISRRGRGSTPAHPNQGLTLIECLVAIIMVGLVVSSIAPALVLSVATRVQNQKAEQALKLAQSEIDRVRVSVERREATVNSLPLVVPGFTDGVIATGVNARANKIVEVRGPDYGALVAKTARPQVNQTRPVDINGDGTDDFAVQIFRSPGQVVGGQPVVFALGVRVYDIAAITSGGTGQLDIVPASLGLTTGFNQRRQRPLAALYTTIAVGDNPKALCDFFNFYGALDSDSKLPPECS